MAGKRYILDDVVRDNDTGAIVASATVTIYLNGTSTAATCYADKTTGTALVGSQTTTDSTGYFSCYVDAADYRSTQRFKWTASKTGYSDVTRDDIQVVDDRLEVVNVRDFGATGDDSTDDTTALQAAIDAVPAGGCLVIPGGGYTYRHTGLTFNNTWSNKTVMGTGMPELKHTGTGVQVSLAGTSGAYINGMVMRDIRLTSLTTTYSAGLHALSLTYCGDCRLYNVNIVNARDYAILLNGSVDRCNFFAPYIETPKGWGIYITDSGAPNPSNANKFFGGNMWNPANGLKIDLLSSANKFYGMEIEMNTDDGLAVDLNQALGNRFYGIYVEANARNNANVIAMNSTSEGNSFDGTWVGIAGTSVTPTIFSDAGRGNSIVNTRVGNSIANTKLLDVASTVTEGFYANNRKTSGATALAASTFNANAMYVYLDGQGEAAIQKPGGRRQFMITHADGGIMTFEATGASAGQKRVDVANVDGRLIFYEVTDDASTRVAKAGIRLDDGGLQIGNTTANTNTPSGATARAWPVYNAAGTLLGYVPVYAAEW